MNLKNSSLTLDKKHNLLLKEFENNQKLIPKYYEKIKKLENLKKNNKKKNSNELFEIDHEINLINNKIKSINSNEMDYYLKNSNYMFKY